MVFFYLRRIETIFTGFIPPTDVSCLLKTGWWRHSGIMTHKCLDRLRICKPKRTNGGLRIGEREANHIIFTWVAVNLSPWCL